MLESFFSMLRESPALAYWVVLFGAMVEGETVILLASALAAAGYLSIIKVGSIAFCSTLLVDQVLFFVGHHFFKHPGRPLSERFPRLYRRSKRAVLLLKKYDIWFILLFRFVYGIRAVSPVVIGLCGSSPRRFVPLNFASALIWASVSCSLGYWLGDFLFDTETGLIVSGHMHRLQYVIGAILVAVICIIIVTNQLSSYRRRRKLVIPCVNKNATKHVESDFYKSTHEDKS